MSEPDKITVKYRSLLVRRGNIDRVYVCNTVKWNYWLNRYYPNAECIMEIEHLERKVAIESRDEGQKSAPTL